MKTALFTVAFIGTSFISISQLSPNSFRFHHVIKKNKLIDGDYTLLYITTPGTNLRWGTSTLSAGNDTLFVENFPTGTPLNSSTQVYRLTLTEDRLKCVLSLDNTGNIIVNPWSQPPTGNVGSISSGIPLGVGTNYFNIGLSKRNFVGDTPRFEKVGFRSWAMGVAVGTFRYRPKQDTVSGTVSGTVSTALSISVTGGYALGWSAINSKRMTNYSLIAGLFVGLASADLKKGTVENPSEWKTTYDRINPAISYGINTIFSRNNFGIVFSLGFDSNIGPNSKQWIYQNKPWFGIGVNTSLGIF